MEKQHSTSIALLRKRQDRAIPNVAISSPKKDKKRTKENGRGHKG